MRPAKKLRESTNGWVSRSLESTWFTGDLGRGGRPNADLPDHSSSTLQNMGMRQTAELTRLEAALDDIRRAPADNGTVELIVRRPAEDQREVLEEAWLDLHDGLEGDTW